MHLTSCPVVDFKREGKTLAREKFFILHDEGRERGDFTKDGCFFI